MLRATMNHIRAISLDLDDTLWEIGPVIYKAERMLWDWLSKHCPLITEQFSTDQFLEIRRAILAQNAHKSHDLRYLRIKALEEAATTVGYDKSLAEAAFQVFDDARNVVELYADVAPALKVLYERFKLVAVTNGTANLDKIGIRHLFHSVITAADVGVAKPLKPIFDAALYEAGVLSHEMLHVGDHPEIDIDGAKRAGLWTAWINRNDDEWPEHLYSPDVTITKITDLCVLLK
ncbi:uncharacterized protein METZ01_LOCUS232880 [marine metagenome]|uniref:HAD family hydrolase n=1 Tax=marine metagenome TaxID=408172 RepID=A0A382GY68_9ZZZZ